LQHVRAFLTFVRETKAGTDTQKDIAEVAITDADFTQEVVVAWCDDMRSRKIKPQSVNVALNALRYAADRADCKKFVDGVDRLPVRQHRTPSQAKAARALTWSEGKRLVAACDGLRGRDLRDNAIITLGLRTGMLRFSMCQLTFEDIEDNSLTFTKKGGGRHSIVLDAVTYAALRAWMDWLTARDEEQGPVFRSLGRQRISLDDDVSIGAQLTPDGLYRALQLRAKEAGLGDLRPHVFRKTFLAWVKRAGARPQQIEAVTGHKSDGIGDSDDAGEEAANLLLPDWDGNLK
jgi:integrase